MEKISPVNQEAPKNLKQRLAANAWNFLINKLGLEFSQESQENLAQLNELLLTNSAVIYLNHTSINDVPVGVSMVLSHLSNAVNILGPVGMKHYDWRRDPLGAGLLRLLPLAHIQPIPVVQNIDVVDYGGKKREMIENLKRETAKKIELPGSVYGIAPEGTRNSKDGTLLRANRGIGYLEQYQNLFYLPVAIMYRNFSPRPEIVVGKPLQLQDIIPPGIEFDPDPKQRAQMIADLHMKRLAELMPRSLRGVYANI